MNTEKIERLTYFKVVLNEQERKDFKEKMRREAVKQQVYLANLIRKDLYGEKNERI